ncbi:SCP2 domain-containing protein [Pseudoalteromonas sp.]|uniref:ubiquinone anaerobic biosynthesis accessory factor UbiT n=1 Tax=Pseudoalteromonas sp. TaxID=53249 RepID=UPI00356AD349
MLKEPFKPIAKCLAKSLPTGLATSLKLIPNNVTHFAIEKTLNTLFQVERLHNELDFMHNKSLRIEVSDLNFAFTLTLKHGQLVVIDTNEADTTFRADFEQFLLLAGQYADPDTLFFNRQFAISGDTELGLEVKAIIENFEHSRLPKPLNQLIATHCQLIYK